MLLIFAPRCTSFPHIWHIIYIFHIYTISYLHGEVFMKEKSKLLLLKGAIETGVRLSQR